MLVFFVFDIVLAFIIVAVHLCKLAACCCLFVDSLSSGSALRLFTVDIVAASCLFVDCISSGPAPWLSAVDVVVEGHGLLGIGTIRIGVGGVEVDGGGAGAGHGCEEGRGDGGDEGGSHGQVGRFF